MEINADFSKRVLLHTKEMEWVKSPMPGVDRRMLDRIGDDVARATSIVRYAPGSKFSPHVHAGGEELLVLDGVFQDEHGDFPAGSYIRNPPTSSHTPGAEHGCTIFVKLWQFDMDDRTQIRTERYLDQFIQAPTQQGVASQLLYKDETEHVEIQRWQAGAEIMLNAPNGAECLVLHGRFSEGGDQLVRHSWLRLPRGTSTIASVGPQGAEVWLKSGHLGRPRAPSSLL